MSNDRIYRFEAFIDGDMSSYETLPIYDEYGVLIGGFTVTNGNRIAGFLSGTGYPAAIKVTSDESFFFTPQDGDDGKIHIGIISEQPISPISVKITCANEEAVYDSGI